ncbi:ORF6N domain-containing protein, partial [Rhodoferax sp.]|uniref:ORF6N domain-containing protein n=1 Tax=Rhodoferax sp. TaxID=50421 RepID=UPI001A0AB797
MTQIIPKPENLAKLVFLIRGEKVLLDTNLADLYGVEARVLNQSVARNRNRFPDDFMFQLSTEEWSAMRSKNVTSSPPDAGLTSQVVMSNARGGRRTLPYAFTEQGVAMLSSVLRSQRAVEVNIA